VLVHSRQGLGVIRQSGAPYGLLFLGLILLRDVARALGLVLGLRTFVLLRKATP